MSGIKYLELKTDFLILRLTLRQYLKRVMASTVSAARRAIPVTRSLVLKVSAEMSDQKDRRDQLVRLGNLSKARRARRATQANQSSDQKAHPDPQEAFPFGEGDLGEPEGEELSGKALTEKPRPEEAGEGWGVEEGLHAMGTVRMSLPSMRSRISSRLLPVMVRPWFLSPTTARAGSGASLTLSATAWASS